LSTPYRPAQLKKWTKIIREWGKYMPLNAEKQGIFLGKTNNLTGGEKIILYDCFFFGRLAQLARALP
jgi:hypothetical protein